MWIETLSFRGKSFQIGMVHGPSDYSLILTTNTVRELGSDIIGVLDWFLDEGQEWCLVTDFRYAHYDHQFFSDEERQQIYNSKFATDEDKKYCFEVLRREQQPRQPKKPTPGYVYLIRADNGHYKIGRAKNAEDRIHTLGVRLPFSIEPLCILTCTDMIETERALHVKFQDKRIDGEWFVLSDEDVSYIKSLA